jgi:hypothetical protein
VCHEPSDLTTKGLRRCLMHALFMDGVSRHVSILLCTAHSCPTSAIHHLSQVEWEAGLPARGLRRRVAKQPGWLVLAAPRRRRRALGGRRLVLAPWAIRLWDDDDDDDRTGFQASHTVRGSSFSIRLPACGCTSHLSNRCTYHRLDLTQPALGRIRKSETRSPLSPAQPGPARPTPPNNPRASARPRIGRWRDGRSVAWWKWM